MRKADERVPRCARKSIAFLAARLSLRVVPYTRVILGSRALLRQVASIKSKVPTPGDCERARKTILRSNRDESMISSSRDRHLAFSNFSFTESALVVARRTTLAHTGERRAKTRKKQTCNGQTAYS